MHYFYSVLCVDEMLSLGGLSLGLSGLRDKSDYRERTQSASKRATAVKSNTIRFEWKLFEKILPAPLTVRIEYRPLFPVGVLVRERRRQVTADGVLTEIMTVLALRAETTAGVANDLVVIGDARFPPFLLCVARVPAGQRPHACRVSSIKQRPGLRTPSPPPDDEFRVKSNPPTSAAIPPDRGKGFGDFIVIVINTICFLRSSFRTSKFISQEQRFRFWKIANFRSSATTMWFVLTVNMEYWRYSTRLHRKNVCHGMRSPRSTIQQ